MEELREKCPGTKANASNVLTIEETYELGDAILDNDLTEKKELGDLMLHILCQDRKRNR
jgi:XTP/dITP diphosphohydrolase